jgi:hypothetical protein
MLEVAHATIMLESLCTAVLPACPAGGANCAAKDVVIPRAHNNTNPRTLKSTYNFLKKPFIPFQIFISNK